MAWWVVATSGTLRTPFSARSARKKILYMLPEPVNLRIAEKSSVLLSCCFPDRSEIMSSQDSEGECYVADYIADPKSYGDVEHYGWTTDEEEDHEPKGKEESSLDEKDDPLPQPGTCMWNSRSQASPTRPRNLTSNLFLLDFC